MSVAEERLEKLIRRAPASTEGLLELLGEGLSWPVPSEADLEDITFDWRPGELSLDESRLARLRQIRQLRPLVSDQKCGVFLLDFEGDRLPVGAVRRVVGSLARRKRASANPGNPVWGLDDLIFFCHTSGGNQAIHVVAFRERDGKRVLRTLSWDRDPTPGKMQLLLRRAVPDLQWHAVGPAIATLADPGHLSGYRETIRSARALASRMAVVARDLRHEVAELYEVETAGGPIRTLYEEIRQSLIAELTPENFAGNYAQTMVYGLLTARITHPEQFAGAGPSDVLEFDNPFLDAIYARFQDQSDDVIDVDELGLSELAAELASIDMDQILADFGAADRRDDPVVHLYEDFLDEYDPEERRRLGAYYTPVPVVRTIISMVEHLIRSELGLPAGIADQTTWAEYLRTNPDQELPAGAGPSDPVITMLDPATGTGTFLLEWIRKARSARPDWAALEQIAALELSPASYSVAHLKTAMELPEGIRHEARIPIYLSDTLAGERPSVISGMEDPVSAEALRAEQIKFTDHRSIVIGNPPYQRVTKDEAGGWISHPEGGGHSLFDDILDPAKANTIFSHHASLYNLYVYFWRWALWKTFEQNNRGPAVVSFITASSWLSGPGFLGLRQLARELADEIWVIDLGGDNNGARPEENVFNIETAVAIVTLVRRDRTDKSVPAPVHYHRIWGSRAEKLTELEKFRPGSAGWQDAPVGWHDPMMPATGADGWTGYPELINLLPWQQPGCMYNRTWPIAPDPDTLRRRWARFVSTDDEADRAACFVTASSGRNIHTRVAGYESLRDLPVGAEPHPVVRYGYRSFDRQYTFDDPRLAKTDSPSLWASARHPDQVFLASKVTGALGAGPAATLSVGVPDKHVFDGRGGKDIIPLYRDARGTPNADPALLSAISRVHRAIEQSAPEVTVEDLFAYCYAVLAGSDYTERFSAELETPGPRVPVTANPELFAEVVRHGRDLVWLHSYAERFTDDDHPGQLDIAPVIRWEPEPSRIPADIRAATKEISYDPVRKVIRVADGVLHGVEPEVWDFTVSKMTVVKKWLGYRTARGTGRSASSQSPLDQIRPTEWHPEWSRELRELIHVLTVTLERLPRGAELLEQVVTGPLIPADELPEPPPELRKPPRANRSPMGQQLDLSKDDQ